MNAPDTPLPPPAIRARAVDPEPRAALEAAGATPLQARILAGRGVAPETVAAAGGIEGWSAPGLEQLDDPATLPEVDAAADRIVAALEAGETIALETDHDVDGVTAHAVLQSALIDLFGHPAERVQSWIGHRLEEGYGLSDSLADRILAADRRPDLIITADNGSSDEPRIARLAAAGIETIVTDHHALPTEGPPASALVCVSPARADSVYPDAAIAGVMVAWLLMARVRSRLAERGHPGGKARLAGLLDWVALGTVADCVDLGGSLNNRAVVTAGLRLINGNHRPCWAAIQAAAGRDGAVDAGDLAFLFGPRLNARGRLDHAGAGVRLLRARAAAELEELAGLVEAENEARKGIERELLATALAEARCQYAAGRKTLVVHLPDGHAGVHGIVASRLVEATGRPAICLSPHARDAGLVAGSARSVPGLHLRDALQAVADAEPGLFHAFGGHAAAAGLTLAEEGIGPLREAFEAHAGPELPADVGPVVATDGELPATECTLETVAELQALAPFGNGFPAPVFEGYFEVARAEPTRDGRHLRLWLAGEGADELPGIFFGALADGGPGWLPAPGDALRVAFALEANEWRGRRNAQAVVRAMESAGLNRGVAGPS
jgi:single-stranded-DNA-specific exonuclease